MTQETRVRVVGQSIERTDGPLKVTGAAPYTYEHPFDNPLYLSPVRSSVARGRVTSIDDREARELDPSVRVLTHLNAARQPPTAAPGLRVLQDDVIHYRGQVVGAVLATSPEIALESASRVHVAYDEAPHSTTLAWDHPDQYLPEILNGGYDPDTESGDVASALSSAEIVLDQTYRTPMHHHVPIEPQTTVGVWKETAGGAHATLFDGNHGAGFVQQLLAPALGLAPSQLEIIAPYVGGSFGAKVFPQPYHVLTLLAARSVPGRPVKYAMARRHTFVATTYRPATIQRVRIGARRDGSFTAIAHDVVQQTARYDEFAEQTAQSSRILYAAPARRTSHRLVPVDLSVPGSMRAPGRAPGSFGAECAVDELAFALDMDPIELRRRNEPRLDPDTGLPFSSRRLLWCYEQGARRFGWAERVHRPRQRRDGPWWIGTGTATATYPGQVHTPSNARAIALGDGRFRIEIAASDIGTGSRTILAQVAADALRVPVDHIEIELGSSSLPWSMPAGGSAGTTSHSEAVLAAVDALRAAYGSATPAGAEVTAKPSRQPDKEHYAMHAFGAQFAEVAVHAHTGEIQVRRFLGAFDAGRIINPRTARSQLLGGITMGISMALFEEGVLDHRQGQVVTNDLASYHIATHADLPDIEVLWTDEPDPFYNRTGAKGIGEVGIVGVAAAIANAAWHATGIRVRSLPLTADLFSG